MFTLSNSFVIFFKTCGVSNLTHSGTQAFGYLFIIIIIFLLLYMWNIFTSQNNLVFFGKDFLPFYYLHSTNSSLTWWVKPKWGLISFWSPILPTTYPPLTLCKTPLSIFFMPSSIWIPKIQHKCFFHQTWHPNLYRWSSLWLCGFCSFYFLFFCKSIIALLTTYSEFLVVGGFFFLETIAF